MRILVVDDEKIKRVTLADDLSAAGHEVVSAADGQGALDWLKREVFQLVVTDLKMPGLDGIELLRRIKQEQEGIEVIVMTAYGSIPIAVEAMKLGAHDFITKPFRNQEILPLVARIDHGNADPEKPTTEPDAASATVDELVIGESEALANVKRMIRISARTDANVLLCGETGVGKDLLASMIHRLSFRNGKPYVKVGCTLFPPSLIESELYGHEEGSFTGADQFRKGRFELAEGGTIYLDDVDDIPLEQQAKLLRALEEKTFERVGGTQPIQANVRFVASTKLNLMDKIAEGTFRRDLYYRLDVLRIRVPPLRERRSDIPALTQHLLGRIKNEQPCRIDPQALVVLSQHDWPGNIRELYHTLERAALIGAGHISADLMASQIGDIAGGLPTQADTASRPATSPPHGGFKAAMEYAEKQLLANALEASCGNKTAAAHSLGMKASTFRDKLTKHGLR